LIPFDGTVFDSNGQATSVVCHRIANSRTAAMRFPDAVVEANKVVTFTGQ
jgi:hypothetical protein